MVRVAAHHRIDVLLGRVDLDRAFAAVLGAMQLALTLVLAAGPGFAALARYTVTTAMAYPLIVLGLTWCLNLGAPAAARGAR